MNFMNNYNNTNPIIIGIDHGYGNIKTAHCCFKTGVAAYDKEPTFKSNLLIYEGRYYLIGEEHKEFISDKMTDSDYYILTLAAVARELNIRKLTSAHVHLAAGLPLTWVSEQKDSFKEYLLQNDSADFTFKGVDYHVEFAGADIFPQGFSAVADKLREFKGINMLCDIGNGTMNVMYINECRPLAKKCFTEKYGTNQCTMCSRNEKNGGFNPYAAVQLFRSDDNGHSWELINQQMYVPDTDVIPNAFTMEGFSENSLLFCPDGSMVRLLRCGGSYFPDAYGPMFIQRSTDGGYNWTKPEIFDDHGVVPHGVTLGCGVTIVTYGRYGVQVRATDDPACMKWEDPIELLENEWSWPESDGSCSNNCLIALDDHTAAIAYSDFTYRNEDGLRIKSLMYRTITVE